MKQHNVAERETSQQMHRLFGRVNAINAYLHTTLLYIYRICWECFTESLGWNMLTSVVVTK